MADRKDDEYADLVSYFTNEIAQLCPDSEIVTIESINSDGSVNTRRAQDNEGTDTDVLCRNVPVTPMDEATAGGGAVGGGIGVGQSAIQGYIDRDRQKPFILAAAPGGIFGNEEPQPEPPEELPDPNSTCGSWPRLQGGSSYYKGAEETCSEESSACPNYNWDTDDITETNIGTPPTDYGIKLFRSHGKYLYRVQTPARTSVEEVDMADNDNITDTVGAGGEVYSLTIDNENGTNLLVRADYVGAGECEDVPPSCNDNRRQGAQEGQIEGCKDGFADWELDRSGETGYHTTNYAPTCPYNPPSNDDEECYCDGWDNGYEGVSDTFFGYEGGYDECFASAAEGYADASTEAENECFPVGETDCDGGGGPGFLANFDETYFSQCVAPPYNGSTCLTANGEDDTGAYVCGFCYKYTTAGESECCTQYRGGYEDSGDCSAPGSGCP
ncbi:MAG: hypothetical protein KDH96_04140 [Candidatus Riesia sp.]|nr:hypothetical protein [Candidatus Riesia sp.]